MSALKVFMDAVAKYDGDGTRMLDALYALAKRTVGARLFTVLVYDEGSGMMRRIYSNMPQIYPVSQTKPLEQTPWSRHALGGTSIFVANSKAELVNAFGDHETITALGYGAAINVPIVVAGAMLGTINCLHDAGFYSGRRVAAAESLRLPGTISLIMLAGQWPVAGQGDIASG